jgi:hypothetical protein
MTKREKDNVEAVWHIMATLYSAQNALRSRCAPELVKLAVIEHYAKFSLYADA